MDFTDKLDEQVPAWMVMNLISKHMSNQPGMNESNPGLGVEYPIGQDLSAVGGFYKNTQGRNSMYGGLEYMPIAAGPMRFGGSLGGVTGYDKASVLPMLALKAAYESPDFGVNVQAIPNPIDWKRSAIGLQFKKPFK